MTINDKMLRLIDDKLEELDELGDEAGKHRLGEMRGIRMAAEIVEELRVEVADVLNNV